ncbi:MAG: hypothetical protein MUC66_00090 [Methanolinea sp.]|nr:hypothetical protein [Methanolinea sp.]
MIEIIKVMTVIRKISVRKISVIVILLLFLSVLSIPAIAAGGNGGSDGSDGAGSGGSGGDGSGGESAGNAGGGTGSSGPQGPETQLLQEEQERRQQEIIDQPGVQINQQDQDQTQGRTNVDTADESTRADLLRQRDRDLFLQQVSLQEQNLSQVQDQEQAQVDIALYALSISGNVTGSSGPDLTLLAKEVASSFAAAIQAEQQIRTRSSLSRMLFGGDREAAGLLIHYADQNQQHIREMEQLVANCSDCDPQVRVMLEQQFTILSQEQNRITVVGQQEQGERGLFGWLFG